MGQCAPVSFKNISRLKFQAIRARINAQAEMTVMGDIGTATGNGFTAQWNYSEPDQALTITCTQKPWFVSEGLVRDKIQQLVEGVGG